MIDSHPLKSLPSSWQTLVRPMLLISLALHGLLLLLPIPSKQKETPPKQEEKIKITQLPDTPPSPASSPISSPKPQASVIPKVAPPIRRQEAPIQQLAPRPKPLVKAPTIQASPKPQQQAQATPQPTPSVAVKPTSLGIPPYPGAQKGSLGLLKADADKSALHTTDSLEQVDSFFQKLQAKGFNLTPETQYQQAGTKIYEIAQNSGKPQYLYLLPKDSNVVILVASQLKDPKELAKAEASNPDEDAFNSVWDGLNAENSPIGNTAALNTTDLPQAVITTFADTSDQSIFSTQYIARFGTADFSKYRTPDEVINFLKSTFVTQGFDFSEQPKFENVSVYKVTRGSFTNYISIVPTKNNGAGVITSQNSPGQ